MELAYSDPDNLAAAEKLARRMYAHVAEVGMAGMPFADLAVAVAILNGMLLATAYSDERRQKVTAKNIAAAAVKFAKDFKDAPRIGEFPDGGMLQ